MKVVIVGAGMAGLITGYRLKGNPDIEVTLLEKADRPGGRVGTLEIADGFIVDHSAQFLADNYHRTFQLLQELGIGEELEAVDDEIVAQVHEEVRRLLPDFPDRIISHGVVRREEAMALSGPGYQKKLIGLNQSLEHIRGLHLIGDYQTFPTIEGAVYVGEEAAARILRQYVSWERDPE